MKPLAGSRKFWIAIAAIMSVTIVVTVSLVLRMPVEGMLTIAIAIGALAHKLIDAIAIEDAASKQAPLAQAGTFYNSVPPSPKLPDPPITPREALR